jgi:hypothetical protein
LIRVLEQFTEVALHPRQSAASTVDVWALAESAARAAIIKKFICLSP